ncbi:MAG: hypothetical protein EAZ92_15485 [Candidatus Kapaibacterium sp.]|nr:MAG: hypothetical protein EAZ92_15485 [Candidatus Kapabacteria bacterium]
MKGADKSVYATIRLYGASVERTLLSAQKNAILRKSYTEFILKKAKTLLPSYGLREAQSAETLP